MRWLAWFLGAYVLMTLFVGCGEALLPATGVGWILVAIFFIPLWLAAEFAGWIVNEQLFPASFSEKWGRNLTLVLLVLVFSALFFLSWLTVQYVKS